MKTISKLPLEKAGDDKNHSIRASIGMFIFSMIYPVE